MKHDHEYYYKPKSTDNKSRKKDRIITILFLIFIGFYLFTEHRAHVFMALPWIIIALCPLMHIFMHRGHGGHNHDGNNKEDK